MSANRNSDKENKQMAVSAAILEVVERDGLLGVTHSKVSRKSNVSRAWIYEYIGKEKSGLIEFAAESFASHISRLNLTKLPSNKDELFAQLRDGVGFLFDSVEVNPVIIKLYFRFRGSANPLGLVIKKYEDRWLETASKTLQKVVELPSTQARVLAELVMIVRLGFAHRIATSSNSRLAREKAEATLDFINLALSGTISPSGDSN